MSIQPRIILALAGLCGAAGVALAAVAAHVAGGDVLATAAQFLILHAAAAVGLVGIGWRAERTSRLALAAAAALLAGALLFSGDLALRQLAGMKLLFGTAPLGGTVMIVGWILVAAAAVLSSEP
jgi:uncharacterized membrane protein YgdD (TMEM256/DUF423 family)